tara:strand:+ start:33 stop:494 length:462 start_codon:yes stop_codon:yes gene_type:complete
MAFKMKGPSVNISYGGESAKQEKSNLMKDNPVAKHASAMNMSVAQDKKLPEALQDELPQEGRTSPATMVKKVVKPKFKKETELQAPKTDNVISPLNKGGTRNSGDEDNRSDEDKKKIRAKNRARIAKRKAFIADKKAKKVYGSSSPATKKYKK